MFLDDDPQVLAYRRFLPDHHQQILVLTNFYGQAHQINLNQWQGLPYEVVISNYQRTNDTVAATLTLQPYEALAIRINA